MIASAYSSPRWGFRALPALLLAIAVLLTFAPANRADAAKIWFEGGVFNSAAVRGYDVVAYFTQGRPVEGKRNFTHTWQGTTWRFSSARHRDLFAANPEKYAPQYGGWCAWAVSQGYTASTDPDAWKIVDGKLYLNYSKSVQAQWNQAIPRHIKNGDRNWPKIKAKLSDG